MTHEIVVWIFLIAGAVALIAWVADFFRGGAAYAESERSLDSLTRGFSRREIGREQSEEMKRQLQR